MPFLIHSFLTLLISLLLLSILLPLLILTSMTPTLTLPPSPPAFPPIPYVSAPSTWVEALFESCLTSSARAHALSLDVLGLQEIGDPSLLSSSFRDYFLVVAPGPSQQEAGVGLLIAHHLLPRCRAYKRSASGRLVGVVLELTKGQQTLILSAYMPTGLDHRSAHSDAVQLAHELYAEAIKWATGVHQVLLVGDLNETLTALDRLSASTNSSTLSASAAPNLFIAYPSKASSTPTAPCIPTHCTPQASLMCTTR